MLIIGIGNPDRGDDAVGVIVAQRLRQRLPADVPIMQTTGDPGFLMEAWKTAETVILIDAAHSRREAGLTSGTTGAPPGTIHRFDAHESPLPANFFRYSTHALGIPEAIELARALSLSRPERDEFPPQLIVYGIEAKDFTTGAGLSAPVEQAAHQLVELVCSAVACMDRVACATVTQG
jgi:hydrogenase maturation protease